MIYSARVRRDQRLRIPSRPLLWMTIAGFLVFVLLLGLVAVRWPPFLTADQAADGAAHVDVLNQPWLLVAARAATTVGSPLVADLVGAIVILALLVTGFWRAAVLVIMARVGELACESGAKVLLARPRPTLLDPVDHASGFSFPSGHAGGSAAIYGALGLLAASWTVRWARACLLAASAVLISAVAASRMLLGVHYPSDVAAGAALGLAWVGVAALLVTTLPRAPDHQPHVQPN